MTLLRFSHVLMTADEYVAVNYFLWNRRFATRRNNWLLAAALLLLGIAAGLQLWQNQFRGFTSWLTPILLVVGVLYGLGRDMLTRYLLRRGYAKNVSLHQPIDYEFAADGLRSQSAAGSYQAPWPTLRRAVRVGDWLLLYPTVAACYYLDLRQLAEPATAAQVLAILREHGIAVEESRGPTRLPLRRDA